MKKIIAKIAIVLACAALIVSCSGKKDAGSAAKASGPKKTSIGVALYQDGGPAPTATKAFLKECGTKLNCDFKYTVLTQTDEAANLTKIQELIASGVDGIICTMDMGMNAIIEECQSAGVYLGGYLADYDTSYTKNYDIVFKNPYFVGTVADGHCSDDLIGGYVFFDSLMEYNAAHPEKPVTHVSMTTFPVWAFPQHQVYVQQFTEKVEEYNKTAATPIIVDPLDMKTDVLMFSPADSTYFTKHPGIDAVMNFCSGEFMYPAMISAGYATKLKMFAAGYEVGDDENFGSKGTQTYQQEIVSPVEAVAYPLVLLINKINGIDYKDSPAVAQRINASQLIMNSDADMEKFKTQVYLTGNAKDAFLTAEDVYNLTAFNPNATYAGLVDTFQHMTIDDIK